jgi:hypothetical protein
MINSYHQGTQRQIEDSEDIPYDLSYDDMDTFVRSCGVILPETEARDAGSSMRITHFI